MSARVRVPVRVRLVGAVPGDPAAPDRVREAVFRAVSAALEAAPLATLGARGPGDVTVADPTVTAAPGHEDVLTPALLRAAYEGARAGAHDTMRTRAPARTGRTARVTGVPSEPFDPARRRRRGGRSWYAVPFFDGGEAELPLDEGEGAGEGVETFASTRPPLPAAGEVLSLGEALSVAWNWHVYRSGPRWAPATLGRPGYYGSVVVGGAARTALVWIHEVRGTIPENGVLRGADVSYLWWPLMILVPERAGDAPAVQRQRLDPTFASYELSDAGEVATLAAVEAKITSFVERGGYPENFPLRDPDRRRAYAEALLRDDQGRLVEDHRIWNLLGAPQESLSILPSTVGGTTVDGPIRFVTATPARSGTDTSAGGEGGGGGSGSGVGPGAGTTGTRREGAPPAGGPLGASEGGDRLWPTTGVEGEQLVCKPYLAEPPADELTADHGLVAAMRRIAAALEVPECAYLGNFARNAARVVAGRARGIGLAAVRATSTTDVTVRHDGQGNNGFLDIRPGASPEFDYLRMLAGIARQVSDFGTDVVSCYLDRRNAGLVRVDPDRDPDAAGWALRFSGDFGEDMTHGYMHLYAETCRSLLLQQLRSSRQGIVARKDTNFEQTLEAFTATLDILGQTVVELTTLRRAIRHGDDVSATGTVREVLSIAKTTRYRGETYDLPAPITYVPARILDVVGDARVERRGSQRVAVFQGRDWSVTDLDTSIGTRRGLLNQVDPLFLQVSDLESLFAGAQRDPASVRRFLADLLAEMFRANAEMTEESSDPDDGAFFALEASQYVAREGGRDWRGLKFELQGIHALADEQLRARIGRDWRYADGINRAIGRKANWDSFVAIFATVGIITLGLLCAPLGAVAVAAVTGVAGLAMTALDVLEADRQTDLYRSLENPELFLRWQEVQLAQLMAGLSIAFSVFDVVNVGRAAHVIVGVARRGLRVAERAGVGMAVRSIGRSARRELVRNMTQEIMENAVRQAVQELVIVEVMNLLLPRVITPILVPWLRQQALEHGTLAEVDAALGPLAAGLPPPTAAAGGTTGGGP